MHTQVNSSQDVYITGALEILDNTVELLFTCKTNKLEASAKDY